MEVSGEAADLVMKEGVQISEEAIKLLARGAKISRRCYTRWQKTRKALRQGEYEPAAQ